MGTNAQTKRLGMERGNRKERKSTNAKAGFKSKYLLQ